MWSEGVNSMENDRSARTKAGLERAEKLGRKGGAPSKVTDAQIAAAIPLGTSAGAQKVGLSKTQFITRRKRLEQHGSDN